MIVVLASTAAIDCGLWFRDPAVAWYLGISGVLHGVLAAAVVARLRRGELEGWALAGVLLAKLTYEQIHGAMPFDGGMPVVVDAHLYGALAGMAAAVALQFPPRLYRPGTVCPCPAHELHRGEEALREPSSFTGRPGRA